MAAGKGSDRRSGSDLNKFRIGWERTFAHPGSLVPVVSVKMHLHQLWNKPGKT